MKKLLWLILWLVALPGIAAGIDGTQILQKVDRNLEPEAYESYRKLIDIQPDGSKKEYVLYSGTTCGYICRMWDVRSGSPASNR